MKKERRISKLQVSFIAILKIMYGNIAFAQTPYQNPGITDAAVLEKNLKETSHLPQSEFVSSKTFSPVPTFSQKEDSINFQIDKVEFSGGTVFSDTQLQEIAKFYLHKQVTLKELYALASQISRLYQDEGFILSRAVIPPQEIGKNKTAKIQLVEGYVDSIRYEGDVSGITSLTKQYAEKIKQSMPLNSKNLERYLLLMKDLPGLDVETILRPSKINPKASELTVIAKRKMLDGAVGFNNYGSKFSGPHMFNAAAGENSILGLDEKISLQGTITKKTKQMKSGTVQYDQHIGSEGTSLGISASISKTQLQNDLKLLESNSLTKSLNFSLSHPIVRSRSQSFYVGSNFTIRNSTLDFLEEKHQDEHLRIVGINITWDVADRFAGTNLLNVEINRGIKGLGGSSNNNKLKSRAGARYDFTKLSVDFSRLQGLWENFSLLGIVNYQYAFSPLPSSERFYYGGSSHFRGYTNSPISGDTGLKEKIELRYGNAMNDSILSSYQIYGFYALGTGWNKKSTSDERKRTNASEVGGGIRIGIYQNTNFSLEAVKPLKKKTGRQKNPTSIFFGLTQKF